MLPYEAAFQPSISKSSLIAHIMDTASLLSTLNSNELTYEASSLMAWEMGAASSDDEVASFMYRGGRFPPV